MADDLNLDELLDGRERLRMTMRRHPELFEPDPKPQRRDIEGTISGLLKAVDFLMQRAQSQSAEALAAEIAPPIADHVEAKICPLRERLDGLAAEVAKRQPQDIQHKWLSGTLEIKALDDSARSVTGVCNSGLRDRVFEQCDPKGASWELPMSLLLEHRVSQPIGIVEHIEASAERGIVFRASIPRVTEPPSLVDRIETTWSSIRAKLLRSVSIGFLPLASEPLPGGSRRWTKYTITEISLVQIPADTSARLVAWQ